MISSRYPVLVRYLVVGLLNTAIGYGVILVLMLGFDVPPFLANGVGYAIGLLASYWLNRRFAFRSDIAHRKGLPSFIAAAAASYALNAIVLFIAIRMNVGHAFAQALAVLAYSITFYLLNRYAVFRAKPGGALL